MKMPTREELDAVEVTDDDIREWLGNVARLEHALERARIPLTLDWALLMMRFAAQIAATQGMPEPFFMEICRLLFDVSCNEDAAAILRLAASRRPAPVSPEVLLQTWRARVNRLLRACEAGGFRAAGPEMLHAQLALAARITASYGLPAQHWASGVTNAWHAAERAIVNASKATEA